jgi:glycogen debranching enzyme
LERPHRADYERFIHLIDVFRKLGYAPADLLAHSPFLVQDVLFNSILFRADEDLRALALLLNQPTDAIDVWLSRMRSSFDARFWYDRMGLYYDYDLRTERSIQVNTITTFLPLFAGVASKAQAERLINSHLTNPSEYASQDGIRYGVTTTARTEPTWESRRYWRGPVWIITNWLVLEGLQRFGYDDLADRIRQDTLHLVEVSGFREYYDARDGSGCGSDDFSWSAALTLELLMAPPNAENK